MFVCCNVLMSTSQTGREKGQGPGCERNRRGGGEKERRSVVGRKDCLSKFLKKSSQFPTNCVGEEMLRRKTCMKV